MAEHYRVDSWKGLPQFRCAYCMWDTVAEDGEPRIQEHLEARHPDKLTGQAVADEPQEKETVSAEAVSEATQLFSPATSTAET